MAPPAKKAKTEEKPSTSKSGVFASSKGPSPPTTDGSELIARLKKERLEVTKI